MTTRTSRARPCSAAQGRRVPTRSACTLARHGALLLEPARRVSRWRRHRSPARLPGSSRVARNRRMTRRAQKSTFSFLHLAAHDVEDFVTRAHRVVVGLAGWALLVAVFAVLAVEDAIPRAVL